VDSHFDEDKTRWFLRSVLPHEPALRAWLSTRRLPGLEVDDVIQETYSLVAARERFDDIQHPKAYLFQTARSLVVRHVRRARIVSFQALEEMEDDIFPDDRPSPEQACTDRDALRRLAQAIAALPPQAQRALILRRVHELSQREIARRMGLSENTVEKHIARGIRLLIAWRTGGGSLPPQVSSSMNANTGAPHGRTADQPTDRRPGRRLGGQSRQGRPVRR
jgi:RNA polymerase sigma-70 factor (ECF subfamily)